MGDRDFQRYQKQLLFAGFNEATQQMLADSRVLICGCGALGTVLSDTLTRAGVGYLRIVDRDFVDITNLQRQVLFDEADVAAHMPKAVTAADKLRRINSQIEIEPIVADIDHTNILEYADGVDLILDGTDNFEIRFLINDAALEKSIPWVYAGVLASHGQMMPIFPGETACLRCLMDRVPEPGSTETCDTAGVLGPAVNVVASLAALEGLKILTGKRDDVSLALTVIDVWDGTLRKMNVANLRENSDCPACKGGERRWLEGYEGSKTTALCGRNAVQVAPTHKGTLSLETLAEKLATSGKVEKNPYLVRLTLEDPDYEVTVFRDGRAIIKGTEDLSVARGVYSRYVGS